MEQEHVEELVSSLEHRIATVNLFVPLPSNKNFVRSLLDYLDFLDATPEFASIWPLIQGAKEHDLQELTRLESLVEKDADETFGKVLVYTEKNGIVDKDLTKEIDMYRGMQKGDVKTTSSVLQGKLGELTMILNFLIDLGHREFIKQFYIEEDGNFVKWSYSKHRDKLDEVKKKAERLRHIAIWQCFEDLGNLYSIYRNYEKIAQDFFDKKEFFSLMSVNEIQQEIDNLLEGKPLDKIHILDIESMKYQVNKLHVFILDHKDNLGVNQKKEDESTQGFGNIQQTVNSLFEKSEVARLDFKNDNSVVIEYKGKMYSVSTVRWDSNPYRLIRKLLEKTKDDYECSLYEKDFLDNPEDKEEDGLTDTFPDLISKLKFKGFLRNLFFPQPNKEVIHFRRVLTAQFLSSLGITPSKLEQELQTLPFYDPSRNPQKSL